MKTKNLPDWIYKIKQIIKDIESDRMKRKRIHDCPCHNGLPLPKGVQDCK